MPHCGKRTAACFERRSELALSPELSARHGVFLSRSGRRVEVHLHPDEDVHSDASNLRRVVAVVRATFILNLSIVGHVLTNPQDE